MLKRIGSIIIIISLLVSLTTISFAKEKSPNGSIISEKGYSYYPNLDRNFEYIGDITIELDLQNNTGNLRHGKNIYDLSYTLETVSDTEIDITGTAKLDNLEKELLITLVIDGDIKIFGMLDGDLAFNAGKTISHNIMREHFIQPDNLSENLLPTQYIESITSSSDPNVGADGSSGNIYAQIVIPSNHAYGTQEDYFIRINTLNTGFDFLKTVKKFSADGNVINGIIRSIDPLGDYTLSTNWFQWIMYNVAGKTGVLTDSSINNTIHGYKGYGIFDFFVSTNSKWETYYYEGDSDTDGAVFSLWIENSENRRPNISLNTSLYIYESMIGYFTKTGPTLNY